MASDKFQLEKLTVDCWSTWKFQMTVYLDGNGLLGVVDGTEPRQEDAGAATQDWDKREKKAKMALVLAIDKSLLYVVINCQTSAEIWVALRQHFEKTNAASVYYLLDQLSSFKLKEGDEMEPHLKAFTELTNKVEAVQLQLPEQIKVHAMLRSLPASYQMLRTSLQMKGDDLRLDEVCQALAAEDQQRKGTSHYPSSVQESAFSVNGRFQQGAFRGRGGRGRPSQQQIRINGPCYNCGTWGHMARDCTTRSNDHERSNRCEEEFAAQEESAEHLLSVKLDEKSKNGGLQQQQKTTYAEVVKRSRRRKQDQWIVDSGASCHMTGNSTAMQCYKAFSSRAKSDWATARCCRRLVAVKSR